MFQAKVIGNLGADAEVKSVNGKEFTTFRVAHSDKWTDEKQQVHEVTQWVDCVLNGKPNVVEYLKKGTTVFAEGNATLRTYSSPKDKCLKAGITISVRSIELIGGRVDNVPSILYRADDGTQVQVTKWYYCKELVRDESQPETIPLVSRSSQQFVADRGGFIFPFNTENAQ